MADWIDTLRKGATEQAWDNFITRYRPLIFATIQHYARDYDDVMDVFARVCEALREDDMRRLRNYIEQPDHTARFSTWLVVVIRHLTIDWFRSRDGRRTLSSLSDGFSPLRRKIFEAVFLERRTHIEAYELICSQSPHPPTFREFLVELRDTYKSVSEGRRGGIIGELAPRYSPPDGPEPTDPAEVSERAMRIEKALQTLEPQDRAAVELYVIEEIPASDIARVLGFRNAKAVYNKVYRALDALRGRLGVEGLTRGDL